MLPKKKETHFDRIILIFLSLICPIVAIAPLGSWIPLAVLGIVSFFFLETRSKNTFTESSHLIIFIAFIWILLNVLFILKNFFILEKVLQLIFLIFSGLVASKFMLQISNVKKPAFIFAISFISSALLVILDTKFNLGVKLWLSKNFDFSNFKSFYELKQWISLSDFKVKYFDLITSYNDNSYSRGVIALVVFSFPLIVTCIFYKYKILACMILLMNFLLIFFTSNLSIIFCTIIAIFSGVIYYFKTNKFKKYFLWLLGIYFLFCPFFLGQIDYKSFSEYENSLILKRDDLLIGFCENNHQNNFLYAKKNILHIQCFDFNEQQIGPFPQKFNNIDHNLFELANNFENFRLYIKYIFYTKSSDKMHRLIIWSYVKEKILEKPLFGHGFLSSRNINNEERETLNNTKYQLIPLHPHNSILEIWLELGAIGIIIFFIFLKILLNKMYYFDRINHKVTTVAIISFFQIFYIGQISFSFWQPWWVAIILITFILYKIVFKLYDFYEPRSDVLN